MKNKSILCLGYKRRDIVCGVLVGIFFISICVQTVLHFLKASVIDVDETWGKGDRFTGEAGE
jgi:hypothetical protein